MAAVNKLAVPAEKISKVAFLGSPEIAVVALRALVSSGVEVGIVITQPDRRRGRGSKLVPTPVKRAALDLDLPVSDSVEPLYDPGLGIDLGVVVAYGRIIELELLQRLAMVNLHFSLLPRWRGAAPVERAILAGDAETGVCLMAVAEKLDSGGVYARTVLPIDDDISAEDLRCQLGEVGSHLLVEQLKKGLGVAEAQRGEPTYAAKLKAEEFELDFSQTTLEVHRRVRVGRAWTLFEGHRFGVVRTTLSDRVPPFVGAPGTLEGDCVATGDGWLCLAEVKPEGRQVMTAEAWRNGTRPVAGTVLGR